MVTHIGKIVWGELESDHKNVFSVLIPPTVQFEILQIFKIK